MHDGSSQHAARDTARILIAEDHLDSREALRILLESAGYDVAVVADGQAALDRALVDPPDLILLDVMMPQMDGLEVARRLRSAAPTRAVPIIAITAMHGVRELALAAGVDDVMDKPIDIRSLLELVRDRLASEASR